MVNTIALRGHGGNVGRHVLPHLVKAHQNGVIKLIVLVRPSSAVQDVPKDIEVRAIDVESEEGKRKLPEQLKDVNALIATLGIEGLSTQSILLEAVSQSPNFVTFFPSEYGAPWTAEMLSKPAMKAFAQFHDSTLDKAASLGVPVTRVKAGMFPDYAMMEGFIGIHPKDNRVQLYKGALHKPLHISAYDHLGAYIAALAIRPLNDIKGKTFYSYSHSPTGQDIIEFLTTYHGAAPSVTEYTQDQYIKDTDEPGFAMVAATYRKRWGEDKWGWNELEAEWVDVKVPLFSFEELARASIGK